MLPFELKSSVVLADMWRQDFRMGAKFLYVFVQRFLES
jgi:hypothetical protein